MTMLDDEAMVDNVHTLLNALRLEGRDPFVISMSEYRRHRERSPEDAIDFLVLQDGTYHAWVRSS